MENIINGKNHTGFKINLFDRTKELGRVIGLDGTLDILILLNEKPRQYKEINSLVSLSQTSLSRRLNILKALEIIRKQPIRSNRRETHEYDLTLRGAKLMSFIESYEKEIKLPLEQQKIPEISES